MKILMIAPTPFFSHRGTHIRIFEEARALERRGHDVRILTYHVGDDIHNYVKTKIDVRRIRRWLFWYKKTEAGADWQKVILNLFLLRKVFWTTFVYKPDIIHGHLHEGIIIGYLAQKFFFWRRMPLIADFHGSLVGEMKSHGYLSVPGMTRLFHFLEKKINRMGHAAIVSSVDHVVTIKNSRPDGRAYHIYDGVDAENYLNLHARRSVLRAKYDIPLDAIVVVYTGGLVKNKGIHHLLDAAAQIITSQTKSDQKTNIDTSQKQIYFVIGGDQADWVQGYMADRGVDISAKLQSDASMRFTLIYPLNYFDLPRINAMADIAIDPKNRASRQASGKILQYMAAETAIICADRETNRTFLGDAGAFVETVDAESLKVQILVLATDEKRRHQIAHAAHERALKFSWSAVGERLEGVYLSVY